MKETAKVMWCALVLVCVWTTGCKSTAPVEGSATQELTASASDETGKQDEGPNAEVSQPTQDDTSADLSSGVDVSSLPFYATGPVAIVDGEEITAEQFNAEVSKLIRLIGGNLPPQMAQFYKKQILQRVVDEYLLDAEVAKKKITVSDEDLQKEYDKFVARFPSKEQFEMYFKRSGMSEEELREELRKRMTHERLLDFEEVTEAEIRKYYGENIERFREEEEVKARHILFKLAKDADDKTVKAAEKKAKEIEKLAKKKGADFGELAREHSEGPSAPDGGDLGFFPRKRMVKPFADAAFELEPGEVSGVVRTQFGLHIIKVEERKPAQTRGLNEARPEIEHQLASERKRDAAKVFTEQLRESHSIQFNEIFIEFRKGEVQ